MKASHLYQSVSKGYSLLRAYENAMVSRLDFAGNGIDLGAKSSDSKYYEYMDMSRVKKMDFVDYFHSGENIIRMDLDREFPIETERYDFVLAFNVMEHLYNYRQFLEEARRIMRAGATFHGFVPLMWHYHPDPNDYFRFTVQALERLMEETGFSDIRVTPVAAGRFKVATQQIVPVVPLKILKFFVLLSGVWFDRMIERFTRGNSAYALAYYFTGRK